MRLRNIVSTSPLEEGKIPPIVKQAREEADKCGGVVVSMGLTSAIIGVSSPKMEPSHRGSKS